MPGVDLATGATGYKSKFGVGGAEKSGDLTSRLTMIWTSSPPRPVFQSIVPLLLLLRLVGVMSVLILSGSAGKSFDPDLVLFLIGGVVTLGEEEEVEAEAEEDEDEERLIRRGEGGGRESNELIAGERGDCRGMGGGNRGSMAVEMVGL